MILEFCSLGGSMFQVLIHTIILMRCFRLQALISIWWYSCQFDFHLYICLFIITLTTD